MLIIRDEAEQKEDLQLAEHSLLQPSLFRGSSEPIYVINEDWSSVYHLEDNSGDDRNARLGYFGYDSGDGIGRLLHSSLSGREERQGFLEGEELCSFLGLPLIGWVILTFLGYFLHCMGIILHMKALNTEPGLH